MSKLNLPPINPDGSTPPLQPQPTYEFGAEDNTVFAGLANAMRFVSVVSLVVGILIVVAGLLSLSSGLSAIVQLGEGVVMSVIAIWLFGASGSFRDIVNSQGADIIHLMTALRKLGSVYKMQALLWGIAIVLFAVGLMLSGHHG